MSETPIDDGGPAFPRVEDTHVIDHFGVPKRMPGMAQVIVPGMSLRDWFAGQAMAGHAMRRDGWGEVLTAGRLFRIATDCYALADAMLAARKAKPGGGA